MLETIHLKGRDITLEGALEEDKNIVLAVSRAKALDDFEQSLWRQRQSINALVRHHMGLTSKPDTLVRVLPRPRWRCGRFNVCVIVGIGGTLGGTAERPVYKPESGVIFRCPMPHELSQNSEPSGLVEKMASEVANYIWIDEHCPEIRIPHLYGFGFGGSAVGADGAKNKDKYHHRQFTHVDHLTMARPVYNQTWQSNYSHMQRPLLSKYVEHPIQLPSQEETPIFTSAYIVIELIGREIGQMLSNTFPSVEALHLQTNPQGVNKNDTNDANNDDGEEVPKTELARRHKAIDPAKKERLYRGICRAMLALARVPQPRIGSLVFNVDDGTVSLANRPMFAATAIAENDHCQGFKDDGKESRGRPLAHGTTYDCTDSFVADMLSFHEHRLFLQPGQHPFSVRDDSDARFQIAILAALRMRAPLYMRRQSRKGPFLLQFTDLHASNILVDDDWNVTGIVDLEWICALPGEMLDVPYWLTGCSIDGITGYELERFDKARREFTRILKEEEEKYTSDKLHGIPSLHEILETNWATRSTWFSHCLTSINAMHFLVEDHLFESEQYISSADEKTLASYWRPDVEEIVSRKLKEREEYDINVRNLFSDEQI